MKRLISLCVLFLAGCSGGGVESVSQTLPESESIEQETMEAHVKVYSAAGSTDGIVFLADQRDKWIVTEAAVFRDHPAALIETSEGQRLEAELQAFDIEKNIAIVHMRNSAKVEAIEQENQPLLEELLEADKLTARERYMLHDAFKDVEVPQKYDMKVLKEHEKPTFTYNPDAIEHFVYTFNAAFNQYVENGDFSIIDSFILSDLLKEALQKEEAKIAIKQLKVTELGQSGFEWYVKGETDELSVTYKINLVNESYYMTYMHIDK